jgi:UDP-N-acetylglucosamine 2-epimerase (non-hydrolysing)
VVGTRPEAVKLVPVILALRASESFEPVVVSTGQHHEMVAAIFALAEIEPDVELWIGGHRAGRLNELVASVLRRFEDFCVGSFGDHGASIASIEEVLDSGYPGAVLVHGDTSSAMAAALAAFHLRIPVVHVEAGLRTGGTILSPFPEELNRQLISCLAAFNLAPTWVNAENLIRETIPGSQIFVTGNSGIDALQWAAGLQVPYADGRVREADASGDRLVVVTGHRRENWDGGLAGIADGVAGLANANPTVRFVVPLHPNPTVRAALEPRLEHLANVILTEPIPYAAFARLLARCHFAITDSGGIQEEAPSLGKPVLVTRNETERREGVDAGTLLLVGTHPKEIERAGTALLEDADFYRRMADAPNPYGDGRAAERIIAALEHLLLGGPAPRPFGPGFNRHAILAAAGYAREGEPLALTATGERGLADPPLVGHRWHLP